ncbi:MAG: hypothetical protein EP343_04575 [Deltaproteobacteria bacterium]|nr:MAG: hypothetical protein EP343_04575 [Deltaproteobacteria bacterium]
MTNLKVQHLLRVMALCATVWFGLGWAVLQAQPNSQDPEEESFDTAPERPALPYVPEPVPEPQWKNRTQPKPQVQPKKQASTSSKGSVPRTGLNLILGDVRLWGEMHRNYYMLHVDGLGVQFKTKNPKTRKHFAFGFEVFRVDMEYWGELFNDVDSYRLFTSEIGTTSFELGSHGFFVRNSWKWIRFVTWGLPERILNRSVIKRLPAREQSNLYLEATPQFLLPELTVGWGNDKLRFEFWAGLLSWDFQSHVVGGRFVFSIPELTLILESKYQREGMFMEWSRGSEDENLGIPGSFWIRTFWESSLSLSFDIAVAFRKKARHVTGPIQLLFGIRYRHMFEHHLHDTTGSYFREEPTGNFAIFGGLRVSFGSNNLRINTKR